MSSERFVRHPRPLHLIRNILLIDNSNRKKPYIYIDVFMLNSWNFIGNAKYNHLHLKIIIALPLTKSGFRATIQKITIIRRGIFLNKRVMLFILISIMLIGTACSSNETVDGNIILPDNIPSFVQENDLKNIDWKMKAVEFGDKGMIGNENKTGVIGADLPSLQGQKWMWHLWGASDVDLTIVALHKETNTVHSILQEGWTTPLNGPNNGADGHIPSSVTFPEPGEWAVLLYTDGELFDTLVFDINE